MAVKVYKFGGALLNKIEGFEQLKTIIANNIKSEKNTIIVVISALQKTTSRLLKAAKTAELQGETKAMIFIDEIFDYHFSVANQIINEEKNRKQIISILEENKSQIAKIIRGISITKELTPRTKDLVLSFGEILASNIATIFLSETFLVDKQLNIILFDIKNVLETDSNYGAAVPNIPATQKKIEELLLPIIFTKTSNKNSNKIIVTQGFIASNQANETTTMGYESSNLTATILAGLTNADEFIIWSDTEGIRQSDPKLSTVHTPKLVEKISYDFAEFLAYCGLKLIHPPMIKYLKMFNLEVVYKSGFVPDGDFSLITKDGDDKKYRFLIHNDNLTLYYKSAKTSNFNPENFPHLDYFLRNHSNTIHISPAYNLYISSETSLSIENDLLANGFEKIESVSSTTFIYSEDLEAIKLCADSYNSTVQIYEIFINSKKKTAFILYKSDTENKFIESTVKYFERVFG